MRRHTRPNRYPGMKTSPWIIVGSTVILLVVVVVLAVQNTHREQRYVTKILREKGAALIRAAEAGARTGMMGRLWGGQQIQRLLEETASLPDVVYMAVLDPDGITVAHSDPSKIGVPFRPNNRVVHLGPGLEENWALVPSGRSGQVFEVHRRFEPMRAGHSRGFGHMRGMMHRRSPMRPPADDWYAKLDQQDFLIVVGLDVAPFQEAIRDDIRTTVVLSVVLLLLGFGGFVSIFWMNSYRIAKRTLQDTSAFANEVVSHLPVGLIATNRDGQITFFNSEAGKITGLDPALAKGRPPDSILPAQLCGLQRELDMGAVISEKEMECAFAGDRSVPVSTSATRIINEVGEFVGQVLMLRDLGEMRRLQDEVRRQEKLAALGGLAAGVAHEIRNPLSSIKGLATYFAAQFETGSESERAAGVMIQEVDRLNRVITELLDFARPTDLKCTATDLRPLLERSLQLIQQEAANSNIRIDSHIEDNTCPVMIDADSIAQCLLNIYLNALQAMERDGVLTVRCTAEGDSHVRITIRDTGPGIPADHLDKIFDPYFTTKSKGTGLGLAIVHKIAEAHKARLTVSSVPGQGAAFTLHFTCLPAPKKTSSP